MTQSCIYFSDNFFSAGMTDIYDDHKQKIGQLDLKSAFTSSVDVIDLKRNVIVTGRFPFFSMGWEVSDQHDTLLGTLRRRLSFLSKRYEYQANQRGVYRIESEVFSKEYRILNEDEQEVASFEKVSSFFQSPAFRLTNYTDKINNLELVAVVMGVNMLQKRNSNAAGGS